MEITKKITPDLEKLKNRTLQNSRQATETSAQEHLCNIVAGCEVKDDAIPSCILTCLASVTVQMMKNEICFVIKNHSGEFSGIVIWYACAYVEHITLTLTLILEGFKTIIFSVTLSINSASPPPEETNGENSYLGLGLLPVAKT